MHIHKFKEGSVIVTKLFFLRMHTHFISAIVFSLGVLIFLKNTTDTPTPTLSWGNYTSKKSIRRFCVKKHQNDKEGHSIKKGHIECLSLIAELFRAPSFPPLYPCFPFSTSEHIFFTRPHGREERHGRVESYCPHTIPMVCFEVNPERPWLFCPHPGDWWTGLPRSPQERPMCTHTNPFPIFSSVLFVFSLVFFPHKFFVC